MGRPRVAVDIPKLKELMATDLTVTEIAKQLGCSFDIVRARMREHKLSRKRNPLKVCRAGIHDLTQKGAKSINGQCLACKREHARKRRNETGEPMRIDSLGRHHHGVYIKIDLERVKALRDQGKTLRQIGAEMGVAYGTLTKRTAKAGICFTVGMTPERWEERRRRRAAGGGSRPRDTDLEQARRQGLFAEYLDAVVEEETLPPYLRGRAAKLKAVLEDVPR
jgi:hypothetical protein